MRGYLKGLLCLCLAFPLLVSAQTTNFRHIDADYTIDWAYTGYYDYYGFVMFYGHTDNENDKPAYVYLCAKDTCANWGYGRVPDEDFDLRDFAVGRTVRVKGAYTSWYNPNNQYYSYHYIKADSVRSFFIGDVDRSDYLGSFDLSALYFDPWGQDNMWNVTGVACHSAACSSYYPQLLEVMDRSIEDKCSHVRVEGHVTAGNGDSSSVEVSATSARRIARTGVVENLYDQFISGYGYLEVHIREANGTLSIVSGCDGIGQCRNWGYPTTDFYSNTFGSSVLGFEVGSRILVEGDLHPDTDCSSKWIKATKIRSLVDTFDAGSGITSSQTTNGNIRLRIPWPVTAEGSDVHAGRKMGMRLHIYRDNGTPIRSNGVPCYSASVNSTTCHYYLASAISNSMRSGDTDNDGRLSYRLTLRVGDAYNDSAMEDSVEVFEGSLPLP